jgi:hypothetical protein
MLRHNRLEQRVEARVHREARWLDTVGGCDNRRNIAFRLDCCL